MNPILRPYQSDLISRVFYQWQTHRRILAQLPTGGGKSVIFGAIASHFAHQGLRILLMAHREELIIQAHSHLSHWCNCEIGIIKAGYPEMPLFPVQVASVQSLVNRLDRVGHFDLIIIDEGVDIPALECVMLARPTKSLSRYLQMCGRVLRIAEVKTHGLIIDMTKSWATHGLPDFPRKKWQLEGIPPSKQELEVDDDREVKVKVKPDRLIPLADALPPDRELIEITGEGAWDNIYSDLVAYAIEKGYKAAWIRFRLEELKPPLTIWTKYAQMMKYKPGWAFYRWQEQKRGMAV